jgi:hypothetical protein
VGKGNGFTTKKMIYKNIFFIVFIAVCYFVQYRLVLPTRERKHVVMILGSHRSGTSALTNTLAICGSLQPSRYPWNETVLIQQTNDEPNGYWEHGRVVQIHQELLQHFNYTDVPVEFPKDWMQRFESQVAKVQLKAIIQDELSGLNQWLIKDPRMSLLFPLWSEIAEELDVEIVPILTIRNPNFVAQSLHRRQNMSLQVGKQVWLRHCSDAVKFAQIQWIIDYDDLVGDPCLLKQLHVYGGNCTCARGILNKRHRHHHKDLPPIIDEADMVYHTLLNQSRHNMNM